MSRRISILKKFPKKDLKYDNFMAHLLINKVLKNGKKRLARCIIYKCFNLLEEEIKKKPIFILEKAIKKMGPRVKVVKKGKRKTKKIFPTPKLLNKYQTSQIAIQWIVKISRKHSGKSMANKLCKELSDAYKGTGDLVRKKEEMHIYAESNKSHVRKNNYDK